MTAPDILLREGMSIVDLSDELPSVAGRSYRSRPLSGVRKIVTHHSGALGRPGIQGCGIARTTSCDPGPP